MKEEQVQATKWASALGLRPWRELTVLCFMGMELSWVSLWFRIFTQTGLFITYAQAYQLLGAMLLLVYWVEMLISALHLRVAIRRAVMAVLLVAGMLSGLKLFLNSSQSLNLFEIVTRSMRVIQENTLTIPAEFMILLSVLWIWWRGMNLVTAHIGPVTARSGFFTGAAMILAYGLIAPLTGEVLSTAIYLFLFFGLMMMSAARMYVLSRLRGGKVSRFNRYWLLGMVAAALGVVFLAGISASWMVHGLSAFLIGLVVNAFRIIFITGSILLLPVMYLLLLVLPGLFGVLAGPIRDILRTMNELMDSIRKMGKQFQDILRFNFHVDLAAIKPWVLWGLLLLGVLVVLLAVRHRLIARQKEAEEHGEALPLPADLLQSFLNSLKKGAESLASRLSQLTSLRRAGQMLAAARIRRIYASLMDLSERLEHPRPAASTPLEFLPILEKLFPGQAEDLEKITGAYLRVRYGELPETSGQIDEVEEAWAHIREEAKLKKSGQGYLQRR